tara:strand:+ start:7355 stop:7693 length:339 start_codon:yes stop_codon:yes gene_type:complete
MVKKRARTAKGHYVKDDPTTEKNEAWVEVDDTTTKKAAQKKVSKAEPKSAFEIFISAGEEASVYELRVGDARIRGAWDTNREHVFWKVPKDLVEQTKLHHHYWTGRIISTED